MFIENGGMIYFIRVEEENNMIKIFEDFEDTKMTLLKDLSIELIDNGLDVTCSRKDHRFHFKNSIYLVVSDTNKKFCTKWPRDDSDWLYNKPIMMEFYDRMSKFGFIRDRDYNVYGGGPTVTLIFKPRKNSL